MKKQKNKFEDEKKTTSKSLSKEELEKLKQQYKEGNLKFNPEDIAQAMIDEGVNLKD